MTDYGNIWFEIIRFFDIQKSKIQDHWKRNLQFITFHSLSNTAQNPIKVNLTIYINSKSTLIEFKLHNLAMKRQKREDWRIEDTLSFSGGKKSYKIPSDNRHHPASAAQEQKKSHVPSHSSDDVISRI